MHRIIIGMALLLAGVVQAGEMASLKLASDYTYTDVDYQCEHSPMFDGIYVSIEFDDSGDAVKGTLSKYPSNYPRDIVLSQDELAGFEFHEGLDGKTWIRRFELTPELANKLVLMLRSPFCGPTQAITTTELNTSFVAFDTADLGGELLMTFSNYIVVKGIRKDGKDFQSTFTLKQTQYVSSKPRSL